MIGGGITDFLMWQWADHAYFTKMDLEPLSKTVSSVIRRRPAWEFLQRSHLQYPELTSALRCLCLFVLEMGSGYVVQADLKLGITNILPPHLVPLKYHTKALSVPYIPGPFSFTHRITDHFLISEWYYIFGVWNGLWEGRGNSPYAIFLGHCSLTSFKSS